MWKKGVVILRLDERFYVVETFDGEIYRRNRYYLRKIKESFDVLAILDMIFVRSFWDSLLLIKIIRKVFYIEILNICDVISEFFVVVFKSLV